jgi:hypothetical protein
MNETASNERPGRRIHLRLWLVVALAAAAVLAANAHLIYVATISQPACVTHLRQGDGSVGRGLFSAAQSSCTPPPSDAGHS